MMSFYLLPPKTDDRVRGAVNTIRHREAMVTQRARVGDAAKSVRADLHAGLPGQCAVGHRRKLAHRT